MGTTKCSLLLFLGLLFAAFSNTMALTCKPGRFISGGKCQLCPPGTFQDEQGASSCKPCPAGYFNRFRGAQGIDVCEPCKPGTFNPKQGAKSSASCKRCPKGKDSVDGSPKCISCPKGQVISKCPLMRDFDSRVIPGRCLACFQSDCSSEPAQLKCRKCDAGYFSSGRNSKKCIRCDDRFVSLPGDDKCGTCPPGTGGIEFVGNSIKKCVTCTFQNFNDGKFGQCRACPPGFQANARKGGTKCVPCPPGTFGPLPFGRTCRPCPSGQNSFVTAATACLPDNTPCPSNFFRNFRGACQRCTKQQRYNKKKKTCKDCGKDEASEGGLATKCTKCPSGSVRFVDLTPFSAFSGDIGCVCKDGFVRMKAGNCGACPAGTAKKFPDDTECTTCEPGTFAPRAGMSECLSCPVGTVQRLPGQRKCIKCPKGLKAGLTDGQFFPGIGSERCADPKSNCRPDEMRRVSSNPGSLRVPSCTGGASRPCTSDEFLFEDDTRRECLPCSSDEVGVMGTCKPCPGASKRIFGKCECVSGRAVVKGKCEFCKAGTFGVQGATGCKKCPAGTFQNGQGSSGCKECKSGTFSKGGASKCTTCPNGTVTYGRGNASCVTPGSLKK